MVEHLDKEATKSAGVATVHSNKRVSVNLGPIDPVKDAVVRFLAVLVVIVLIALLGS